MNDLFPWRPLIVGQAPSRPGDPALPLTGACGRSIAQLMGLTWERYLMLFSRTNVFDRYPGRAGAKGDDFPIAVARIYAEWIITEVAADRRPFVVLLGKNVARAFGVTQTYFVAEGLGGVAYWVMPHPSRVSLFWNDRKNFADAEHHFKIIAEKAEEVYHGHIKERHRARPR